MANRRRVQRRRPKDHVTASKCISIMPDGSASIFTPKKKQPRTHLAQDANGSFYIQTKERALY